jgi:hypothetical protein
MNHQKTPGWHFASTTVKAEFTSFQALGAKVAALSQVFGRPTRTSLTLAETESCQYHEKII